MVFELGIRGHLHVHMLTVLRFPDGGIQLVPQPDMPCEVDETWNVLDYRQEVDDRRRPVWNPMHSWVKMERDAAIMIQRLWRGGVSRAITRAAIAEVDAEMAAEEAAKESPLFSDDEEEY